jgi:hypothetical protein
MAKKTSKKSPQLVQLALTPGMMKQLYTASEWLEMALPRVIWSLAVKAGSAKKPDYSAASVALILGLLEVSVPHLPKRGARK